MNEIEVKIKKIKRGKGQAVKMPFYATEGSAGLDLCADLEVPVTIGAGDIAKIPTGIAIQIPDKYIGGFVFPRSGLSSKYGVSLVNSVGVIDSDYTGEIICPLINHGQEDYTVQPGDRIAQIIFLPIFLAKLVSVEELVDTGRGSGGFGSTGL